jgi:hypothetical protein
MVEDFCTLFQLHEMLHRQQELNQVIHHKQSNKNKILFDLINKRNIKYT